MRGVADIVSLLTRDERAQRLLSTVASLKLPDCWIGAGFVRNAVWDALHGLPPDIPSLSDVDVVFFDPTDIRTDREPALERSLRQRAPGPVWSVKNQARMHLRNGDSPYRDTADAIAHWPETATAIAARLDDGKIEVIAPYGVADLVDLIVRPTPPFALKLEVFRERLLAKDWRRRWPLLRIESACGRALAT